MLGVLLHFSSRSPTATVKELAAACDLPVATAHRYIALLKELGLVEEVARAQYRLGWRAAYLGQVASETGGLVTVAKPVMQWLAAEANETATLFQRVDLDVECIAQVESEAHVIRLTFEPGQRLKLSTGASARVLLAALDDDELNHVLRALADREPAFAPRREQYATEIAQVRARGWATSAGEVDEAVWAAAVPVLVGEHTVASLAVAAPMMRRDAANDERLIALLRSAADSLGQRLGSRGSR